MKQIAMVFWFFLVTILVLLFYQYRQTIHEYIQKIQEQQKNKNEPLWNHPSLKWPLKIFLIMTAIAWIDLVIWGITSVLPLALFLLVFGGKQAIKDSAHILIILSAAWVVTQLLFGVTPSEFIHKFDIHFLLEVYGGSFSALKPMIIPLVILFFLGISSLIWKKKITQGIIAIIVATSVPFLIGFLFGGGANGAGHNTLLFLSKFYKTAPDILKIVIIPQMFMVIAGIILLVSKKSFSGTIWLALAVVLPWGIEPAKALISAYITKNSNKEGIGALADFYGISPHIFKIILTLQIVFLFSSFIIAFRKQTKLGVTLFLLGLFLPWLTVIANDFTQKTFMPFIKSTPNNIGVLAKIYGKPQELIHSLILPMIVIAIFGTTLLFRKKTSGLGISLIVFSILLPYLAVPLSKIHGHLSKDNWTGFAELYGCSPKLLHSLIIPMITLFILGLVAINKEKGFAGGTLIIISIFLPWIIAPLQIAVNNLQQHPEYNLNLISSYYKIKPGEFLIFFPAMLLLFFSGILQIFIRNRITFGFIIIGTGIYLPFACPLISYALRDFMPR